MFFNPSLRRKKRTTHKSFNFPMRKDIGFQLPTLGLSTDVKTTQSTTGIPSTVVSSQQATLPVTQNTSQSLYTSLFGETNNATSIRNPKSHGFPLQQAMVSPPAPTFPGESLDIPPITPQSSNPSLLRFSSDHVQNTTLPNSIHSQPLQNMQNTSNMLNENVSPFTNHTMDENDDLVEGPLDKIVDQIMDRELNEAIMKTSALSNTFGQHPVVTFTNTPSQVSSSAASSLQHVSVVGNAISNTVATSKNGTVSGKTIQKNLPTHSQSQFVLQPPGSVSSKIVRTLRQTSDTGSSQNSQQQKTVTLQNATDIEELLSIQESVSTSTSKVEPNQFISQLSKPSASRASFSLSSPLSIARPANSGVSTAARANMNLPLPLNVNILQSQTGTASQNNEPNRTQNNIPQKLAFATSVGTSSNTNSTSRVITSQGLNVQRSLAQQISGILSTTHETATQNILRSVGTADVTDMQTLLQTIARTPGLLSKLGTSKASISTAKPTLTQETMTPKTDQLENNFSIFKEANSSSNSLPSHLGTSQPTISATKPSLTPGNLTPKTSQLKNFSIFTEASSSNNMSNNIQSQLGTIQPTISTIKPSLTQENLETSLLNKNFSIFAVASNNPSNSMSSHVDTSQPTISAGNPNLTQANMTPNASQLKNFSIFTEADSSANPSNSLPSHLGKSQPAISATKTNLDQGNMTPPNAKQPNKNFSIFTEASTFNNASKHMSSRLGTPQPKISTTNHNLTPETMNAVLQSISKQTVSESSSSSVSNQTLPTVTLAQSIATNTLKITSPSANIASGFQLPISRPSPNVSSLQHTIFSQASPHLSTSKGQSVTPISSNMHVFSRYQLSQSKAPGIVSNSTGASSVMFTLAPGSQGAATFKALPVAGKDKLAGHQIFVLQQPGQILKNAKQQPVKIIFVNDGSVRQVVSGPQKSNITSSSEVLSNQPPVQAGVPGRTFTSSTTKTNQPVPSPGHDTPEGSPASINSSDSDVLPIAMLKKTEALKQKEKPTEKKKRGTKRRKDPNKPVKPLSTFQRFFQKTQAVIRQQDPNAAFTEVSKIAKQMWENLGPKDRKVYQDEWRTERAQYKKALEEYKASLNQTEEDGPSPKVLKNGQSPTSPGPVSPADGPSFEILHSSASSVSVSASSSMPNSAIRGPHGSGKPLAMMAELANKTKMASGQASGKTPGAVKSLSLNKMKGPGNGVDDGLPQITKHKKPKINPIPKKSCIRENCNKFTKTTKERGPLFCSNECVMLHCRGVFKSWVEARRSSLKAAS